MIIYIIVDTCRYFKRDDSNRPKKLRWVTLKIHFVSAACPSEKCCSTNVSSYLDFPGFIVSLAKDRLQCQSVVTEKQVFQDGTMRESFSQWTQISGRNHKNVFEILQALKVFPNRFSTVHVWYRGCFNASRCTWAWQSHFPLWLLSSTVAYHQVSRVCGPDAMALLGHTPSRALWCPQWQWKNHSMWSQRSLSIKNSQDVCYPSLRVAVLSIASHEGSWAKWFNAQT